MGVNRIELNRGTSIANEENAALVNYRENYRETDDLLADELAMLDPLSPFENYESSSERIGAWTRCTNTRSCMGLYILLITFNTMVLIVELASSSVDVMVVVVSEGFINLFLLIEVVLTINVYRKDYFKSWLRVFDFVITLLCLIFYFIFIGEEEAGQGGVINEDLEYGETVLLGFRYAFQVIRLCSLIYQGRKKTHHLAVNDIRFDEIALDSSDDLPQHGLESVGAAALMQTRNGHDEGVEMCDL